MPGDLNLKKSWNPALLKNQKKVWEREQDALKEHQAIKQRAKEIALEREKEEMIKLQYGDDLSKLPQKQKLELSKVGWMYTEVPQQNNEDNGFNEVEEDFLDNTAQVEQLLQGNKHAIPSMTSRFDKVASVGAAKAPNSLIDDPLLLIRKQRKEQSRRREKYREVLTPRISHDSDHRGSYSRSEHSHRSSKYSSSKRERCRSSSHRHHRISNRSGRHHDDKSRKEKSCTPPEDPNKIAA